MKSRFLIAVICAVLSAETASAQLRLPPEPKNAALLYWQAFAQLQDYPTDKATAELLEKTVSGEEPWNESKFGPFVDDNTESIQIMQRGSELPECDWGFEYHLASRNSFPITYWRNSSRSLARLNILYAMRLAAKGDPQKATGTWIAGIRFSQHLGDGGTLIFKQVASQSLLLSFLSLTNAVQRGQLTAEQKEKVRATVRALPETGFDWGEAWELEGAALETGFREVLKSRDLDDLEKAYESFTGEPMPHPRLPPAAKVPPGTKIVMFPFGPDDFAKFEDYMSRVQAALSAAPELARGRIEALETERKTVAPILQKFIPSPSRVNEARVNIGGMRQNLLQVLSTK